MSIILCSTEPAIRERWEKILSDDGREVGMVSSPLELLSALGKDDVTLALVHVPCIDTKAVLGLFDKYPSCKLILLSDSPEENEGINYFRNGAVGYVNTFISPSQLRQAVLAADTGGVWIGQQLMHKIIKDYHAQLNNSVPAPGEKTSIEKLSVREHEIADFIAMGVSNKVIASKLEISERTVKAHLSSIYRKTGTKGRLQLALLVNRLS